MVDLEHGPAVHRREPDGLPLGTISEGFVISREFLETYGALTNEQFVRLVYLNVLDREPELAGFNYWVYLLSAGSRLEAGCSSASRSRGSTRQRPDDLALESPKAPTLDPHRSASGPASDPALPPEEHQLSALVGRADVALCRRGSPASWLPLGAWSTRPRGRGPPPVAPRRRRGQRPRAGRRPAGGGAPRLTTVRRRQRR